MRLRSCLYTSGASVLRAEAPHAHREDGDERNRNEGDEVLLRALEDDVQPPVAAEPGERSFNHPADAGRDEPPVAAAGNGLDADAERLTDLGQPLAPIAEVAERRTFEATLGERAQDWHDPFGVMPVRRRDIDRQRDAVLVDRNMEFDAADLLAAIAAAVKAARRRTTGSTVDHHRARLRS